MPVLTRSRVKLLRSAQLVAQDLVQHRVQQCQIIETSVDFDSLLQQALSEDAARAAQDDDDDADGWEVETREEEAAHSPADPAPTPTPAAEVRSSAFTAKRSASSPPPLSVSESSSTPPFRKKARRGKKNPEKKQSDARMERSRQGKEAKAAKKKAGASSLNHQPSRHALGKRTELDVVDTGCDHEPTLHVSKQGFIGRRQGVVEAFSTVEAYIEAGYERVSWDGSTTHGLAGFGKRVFGLMVGRPGEPTYMESVRRLATAITTAKDKMGFGNRQDRRGTFSTIAYGISYGGGQKRPGNLRHSAQNIRAMEELLANPDMQRQASYAKSMFATYFPDLYDEYVQTLESLHEDNPLLRPLFDGCAWPAVSVNFPPNSFSHIHTDAGNKANGLCPIFSLGDFDHTKGGHLVLPDLKLIIEFPAGCIIFIPSATLRHGNIPVRPGEFRTSWTLYAAGGLFRWAHYGFQTWATWSAKNSKNTEILDADKKAQGERWCRALEMFPTVDNLRARADR